MLCANAFPEIEPQQIRNPGEGVRNDLNSPLADKIIVNKCVGEVATLDDFFVSQVDIQKLVVDYFTHWEYGTVDYYHWISAENHFVDIETMQIWDVLDWYLEVHCHSFGVIIRANDQPTVATSHYQSQKSVACLYFDVAEIIRSGVGALDNFILFRHLNVIILSAIKHEIVAWIRYCMPLNIS